jgi:2-polyprenyl-3-methyl-5-hydroxy-6-metoxy-1,4-benzoquinol methylase
MSGFSLQIIMLMQNNSQNPDNYFEQERPEMLGFIPSGAVTILDVGCAMGGFGHRLKRERSAEVWGVEVNKYASSIATKHLDKVFCGTFDRNLDLPKNMFDCIIFNDVLEHFVDPYDALTYAKDLLNDSGKIVASIPNVRYFDNVWNFLIDKDWEYTEHGILDRTHLRFFTQKSIINTFESLGYSIDCIQGIGKLECCHPHRVKKYNLINTLLMNQIADMRYLQFAIVASPVFSA